MEAQKSRKNMGMLAGVAIVGGVGNRAAEEERGPRGSGMGQTHTALERGGEDPHSFGKVWNHEALGLPLPCSLGSWKSRCRSDAELSLSSLEEAEKTLLGRKWMKGLSLVGLEKVPHGFGLRTGDACSTADGAGNQGRPAS